MIYEFGPFELDLDRAELRRDGAEVQVEPQVFSLLQLLADNRERVVSKDEIFEKIWDGRAVTDAALTSRVKSARRAVGDDGEAQRVIRTIRGRGFRFVAEVDPKAGPGRATSIAVSDEDPRPGADGATAFTRPSVAVLPFHWLGESSGLTILTDALPSDLITEFSRLRWLAVIARGSSFRFRTPGADIHEIGRTLAVGYCVCGVVEDRGKRIALTCELIDTRDRHVLWGERFDFALDEAHDVRANIVARVIAALEIHIPGNEADLARLAPPESLDAWAEYHLGLQAMYRFNKNDNAAASVHFRRAVKMDPGFARAHAGLSFTSFQDAFLDYSGNRASASEGARRFAERSVELDPHDPFANFTMGRSYWLTEDIETSIGWLDRALGLSPNFAQGRYSRAWIETVVGRGRVGREDVDEAMRLSPLDPLMYAMLGTRALSHIPDGEYAAAADWADKAANAPGSHVLLGFIAIVAHTLAGDEERAAYWAANVKRRRPDADRRLFFRAFPFSDPETRRIFEGALESHGL